jgi:hypothetical protein
VGRDVASRPTGHAQPIWAAPEPGQRCGQRCRLAAPVLGLMGWFTAEGFVRPPYAQLRLAGPGGPHAATVMGICTLAGVTAGALMRGLASSSRLWIVDTRGRGRPEPGFPVGIRRRRQVAGVLVVAGLPLLTMRVMPPLAASATSPAVADS